MTITEFITARLDEEQAHAEQSREFPADGFPHPDTGETVYVNGCGNEDGGWISIHGHRDVTTTISQDDAPELYERIMQALPISKKAQDEQRRVDALRRIAAEHRIGNDPCDAHGPGFESIPCNTMTALAGIWPTHPDYRQEWGE